MGDFSEGSEQRAKIWTAEGIVAPENAKISVLDRGLLFGVGAFETLRSYEFKFFRLEDHINRFYRNLELLNMSIGLDAVSIKKALYDTIVACGFPDARIKFLATAGVEGERNGQFFICVDKLIPFPLKYYTLGVGLVKSELFRNERNITTTIKSLAYLDSYWAREEAKRKGGEEGFFINSNGFVSEGASSNIFLVKDNILITPSLNQGVLPGVTRSFVIELASLLGIEVAERAVLLSELYEADEVFITASIKEIMLVKSIDGEKVGKSRMVTDRLHKLYKERLPMLCVG